MSELPDTLAVTCAEYDAPLLSVADVWEDRLAICIAVAPCSAAVTGLPPAWELCCITSEPHGVVSTIVRVTGRAMTIDMSALPPHASDVTLRVRAAPDAGLPAGTGVGLGPWAVISQRLLPPVSLRQTTVLPDALALCWSFPGWSAPLDGVVANFELRITLDECPLDVLAHTFVAAPGGGNRRDDCYGTHGDVSVAIPPGVRANRGGRVEIRCQSPARGGCRWTSWSAPLRVFLLAPLLVRVVSVAETSVTVRWRRAAPIGGDGEMSADSSLDPRETDVSFFRLQAWPATRRTVQPVAAWTHVALVPATRNQDRTTPLSPLLPSPSTLRSVLAVETTRHVRDADNFAVLQGLQPETVYNMKVQWANAGGGDPEVRFFRFFTTPRPVVLRVPRIGARFFDLEWAIPTRESLQDFSAFADDDATCVPDNARLLSDRDESPLGSLQGTMYVPDLAYHFANDPAVVVVPQFYRILLRRTAVRSPAVDATRGVVTADSRGILRTSDSRVQPMQEEDEEVDVDDGCGVDGECQRFVDVPHVFGAAVQRTRITGLRSATPYSVALRCAGAAPSDHCAAKGYELASYGVWTDRIVVTTRATIRFFVHERGPTFLALTWTTDTMPPLMAIDEAVMRMVPLLAQGDRVSRGRLPHPSFVSVDPTRVLVGIEPVPVRIVSPLGDAAAARSTECQTVAAQVRRLPGERDPGWGVGTPLSASLQLHASSHGMVKFTGLHPATQYRVSHNVVDDEGRWDGRRSVCVETLGTDVVCTESVLVVGGSSESLDRELSGPRIDGAVYLKHREMFAVGCSGPPARLTQPARSADSGRVAPLRSALSAVRGCVTTDAPATVRIGRVGLALDVESLGPDHCVLQWRAFAASAPPGLGIGIEDDGDISGRPAPTLTVALRGDDPPPRGTPHDLSQESVVPSTSPTVPTSDSGLTEYLLRLIHAPIFDAARGAEANGGRADSDFSAGEETQELYFRSTTRRTRLVGLRADRLYKVAICEFSRGLQQWTPWSLEATFAPIAALQLVVRRVTGAGVVLGWQRRAARTTATGDVVDVFVPGLQGVLNGATAADATRLRSKRGDETDDNQGDGGDERSSPPSRECATPASAQSEAPPTVVRTYEFRVADAVTGVLRCEETLRAPLHEYCIRDVRRGTVSVSMRPCYAYGAWGPWTTPIHVAVEPLPNLRVETVGTRILRVTWSPLASNTNDNDNSHNTATVPSHSRPSGCGIAVTCASEDTRTVVELPWKATQFTFTSLRSGTPYRVLAFAACVVDAPSPSPLPSPSLLFPSGGPLADLPTALPVVLASTLKALTVTAASVGEEFAILRWSRVRHSAIHPAHGGDPAAVAAAAAATASLLSHPRLRPQSAAASSFDYGYNELSAASSFVGGDVGASGQSFHRRGQQSNHLSPSRVALNVASGKLKSDGVASRSEEPVGDEEYELVISDLEFGSERVERVTIPDSSKATSVQRRILGLHAGCAYAATVRPVLSSVDGLFDVASAPFRFRTLDVLRVDVAAGSTADAVVIRCSRWQRPVAPHDVCAARRSCSESGLSTPEEHSHDAFALAACEVDFRNPIEVRVTEEPQVPVRATAPRRMDIRSLVDEAKKLFHRRVVQQSLAPVTFTGAPCNGTRPTVLVVAARQRSFDENWSGWVTTRFVLGDSAV